MILLFIIHFVSILFQLLFWAVIIDVLLSWFSREKSELGNMLDRIVFPMLKPFRWARIGQLDFSPFLLIILLDFLAKTSLEFLTKLAM